MGEDEAGLPAVLPGDDFAAADGAGSSRQPGADPGAHEAGAAGGIHGLQGHLRGRQDPPAGLGAAAHSALCRDDSPADPNAPLHRGRRWRRGGEPEPGRQLPERPGAACDAFGGWLELGAGAAERAERDPGQTHHHHQASAHPGRHREGGERRGADQQHLLARDPAMPGTAPGRFQAGREELPFAEALHALRAGPLQAERVGCGPHLGHRLPAATALVLPLHCGDFGAHLRQGPRDCAGAHGALQPAQWHRVPVSDQREGQAGGDHGAGGGLLRNVREVFEVRAQDRPGGADPGSHHAALEHDHFCAAEGGGGGGNRLHRVRALPHCGGQQVGQETRGREQGQHRAVVAATCPTGNPRLC
mmetsp:Transcript_66279/g.158137  ORF Transcript_66279/g.158137 Transcript_66279/m.158137 type:complete len:360 (+) Transcript_66279:1500-2579(+)